MLFLVASEHLNTGNLILQSVALEEIKMDQTATKKVHKLVE